MLKLPQPNGMHNGSLFLQKDNMAGSAGRNADRPNITIMYKATATLQLCKVRIDICQ